MNISAEYFVRLPLPNIFEMYYRGEIFSEIIFAEYFGNVLQ